MNRIHKEQHAMRNILLLMVLLLLAVGWSAPVAAQSEPAACPALVEQALLDLGENCGDLARNSACYGYNRVGATFFEQVSDDFFTQPSDTSDLRLVESLDTAPLNTATSEWGIAILSVQANIPDTLPGQAVRFILLGDVAIENAVNPTQAAVVVQVTVRAIVGANVRSRPSTNANVIGSLPAGTEVTADALSSDTQWVRVTLDGGRIGWVSRDLLGEVQGEIGELPAAEARLQTPMQAFRLRTGFDDIQCDEPPSLMVVQGPRQTQIEITANGVNIRLGSTIVLQTTDTLFQVTTLDGFAVANGVGIPPGYQAQAPLGRDGDVAGPLGPPQPLDDDELEQLQGLENLPENVLNYDIEVPEEPQALPTNNTGGSTTPAAPVSGVNCTTFRPTSPLDGLAYGLNTFFWDAATGADSYRVTVVGGGSATVSAPTTSAVVDLWEVPQAFQMSWFVEALKDGQVACTTSTVTLPREANPPPMFATWECGPGTEEFTVRYDNIPPGSSSVTVNVYQLEFSDTRPVPPYRGALTYQGQEFFSGGNVVANPSGATIELPELGCYGPGG